MIRTMKLLGTKPMVLPSAGLGARNFAKRLCVILLAGAIVGDAIAQHHETRVASGRLRKANGPSYPIMVDSEGRWLLFKSAASNLVTGDTNNVEDLFIYDLNTSSIKLLTVGPNGVPANGASIRGEIASNGIVVIETNASNLDPTIQDTNNRPDILVGHVLFGGWRYLSVEIGSRTPEGGTQPRLSPNGRFAAWISRDGHLRLRDLAANAEWILDRYVTETYGITDSTLLYRALSPTGSYSVIRLIDLEQRRVIWESQAVEMGIGNAVHDGNLIAYVPPRQPQIIVYDWTRNQQVAAFPTGDAPPQLISLRGNRLMYSVHHGNVAHVVVRTVGDVLTEPIIVTVDENGKLRSGVLSGWFSSPLHTESLAVFGMDDLNPPLIAGDDNGFQDIFLRYFEEQVTRGVTIGQAAILSDEAAGSIELNFDGQIAVFSSPASNLVDGDTNQVSDIFIRLPDGQLRRLLNENGEQLNGHSYDPCISADGNTVVFVTEATNIGAGHGRYRLVRYRLSPQQIEVIAAADLEIAKPRVSADGSRVVFATDARLTTDDNNDFTDVYLYDALSRRLTRLPRGIRTGAPTYDPDISPDGRYVAFASEAPELGASPERPQVFVYDTQTGSFERISRGVPSAVKPSISRDGHSVAFESGTVPPQIFVWREGRIRQVSVNSFGQRANLASRNPRISHDGTKIAFESDATNLMPMDRTPDSDIYVHDLATGWTYAVARIDCTPGNAPSFNPSLSGNGRWVAFQTTATNLGNLPLSANGYVAIHRVGCVPPGDVNRDGTVDDTDLLQVLLAYGTESCADVNMDGIVDDSDLLIVLFNFGVTCQFGMAGEFGNRRDLYEGLLGDATTPQIEEMDDLIIYRTSSMTPAYVKSLERQAAEIEMMHRGLWPYPVAGRGSEPWIRAYGDPLTMSPEELKALLDYFDNLRRSQSEEGDFAPASGSTYTLNESRTVQLGGSDVNISVNGSIYFYATCQGGGSVVAEAKGDATIKFFPIHHRVAEAYGKATATNNQVTIHAYFKIAGQTLWSYGPESRSLSWSYASRCHYGGSGPDIGPWTRQWQFTQTWWLGPVPVSVTAGINVQTGACYKLEGMLAPVRAEARFRPYVNSSAFASGGLAFAIVCSASAGVGINLTLLNYAMEAYATLNLGTQGNRCCVFLNAGIHNSMTALAGRFYIYAEACCWRLSGPPCGWGRKRQRWEHDLFRWNGHSSSGYLWGPWSHTHCFK